MAAHIVLEESGEKYEPIRLDLAKGEQRSEAYLKLNPLGRVPVLRLDDGTALAENTAILRRKQECHKSATPSRTSVRGDDGKMQQRGPKAQERPSQPGSDLVLVAGELVVFL
jgi:glutathione S-transferase